MKKLFYLIVIFTTVTACKNETPTQQKQQVETSKLKMLVTHYYSAKMENGKAIRDTLMNCSYCNQAIVYSEEEEGLEIEHRFYKSNMDEMFAYEFYDHDEDRNVIGSEYRENNVMTASYMYELNDNGTVNISRTYDAKTGTMLYGSQYKYDGKGNQYETGNINKDGNLYEYYRRTYNKNGIVMTENIEDLEDLEDKPTFEIRYEYRPQADENWEEQITYYNGKLSEIRVREWIYYE